MTCTADVLYCRLADETGLASVCLILEAQACLPINVAIDSVVLALYAGYIDSDMVM